MKRIFSPWRMKYINDSNPQSECIFCSLPDMKSDRESLIIRRGDSAFVLMNRFPYTSGHIMVAPYAHQPSIEMLNETTQAELMALITKSVKVLRYIYEPEGFNIGANVGSAAGAGFGDHIHFHIVPRWVGDTNFMSTLGEVRVLPEDLETTWERIRAAWDSTH